jgi:hypothetical protein
VVRVHPAVPAIKSGTFPQEPASGKTENEARVTGRVTKPDRSDLAAHEFGSQATALAMIFMVTNVLGAAFALSRKSARQNIASRGESVRAKWDVALARPILAVAEVAGVLVIVTGLLLVWFKQNSLVPGTF